MSRDLQPNLPFRRSYLWKHFFRTRHYFRGLRNSSILMDVWDPLPGGPAPWRPSQAELPSAAQGIIAHRVPVTRTMQSSLGNVQMEKTQEPQQRFPRHLLKTKWRTWHPLAGRLGSEQIQSHLLSEPGRGPRSCLQSQAPEEWRGPEKDGSRSSFNVLQTWPNGSQVLINFIHQKSRSYPGDELIRGCSNLEISPLAFSTWRR